MSEAEASRFVEAVLSDEKFSNELSAMKDNPDALLKEVRSRGYNVTADEVRDALLENLSHRMNEDQLNDIAAGFRSDDKGVTIAAV